MPAKIDFSTLTLMDTLDLAALIETEAHDRYRLFATQLGPTEAGSVFRSMAENEKKHGDALAARRRLLFGDRPARYRREDIFDVEAPEVGSARWNLSEYNAYQVALHSEKKAWGFYDDALRIVQQLEVRALFEELRDEEAEHVSMVEAIIAKLPPSAKDEAEDLDDSYMRMGY
jgi:rubrerythrin